MEKFEARLEKVRTVSLTYNVRIDAVEGLAREQVFQRRRENTKNIFQIDQF